MRIAYVIFDGITWLDFIGIYDPMSRLRSMNYLPDLSWEVCILKGKAKDDFGLEILPTKIGEALANYDAVFIPGGHGTRHLQLDPEFISWIRTAANVPWKLSVCTGSLIWGAAGFLKEKSATTHFSEYDTLKPYCKKVLKQKIVEDGNIITAGAVSSSIDLGLYLCEKWVDKKAAFEIRKRMNYEG